MGIITISRGSYSRGKEIAERLAKELGYACTSRDIILEASKHFHVPELKLVRAIHDSPSLFGRMKYSKERYVAYIRKTFLEHIQKNNIVYHGLAGHFFLKDVPNVLKIRIVANLEDRVSEEMKRENISEAEARRILLKDDEERRKWSSYLYGIDTNDPILYDISVHIDNLSISDAVEILTGIAKRPCFQATEESQKILEEQYLAAKLKVALLDDYPNAEVRCVSGAITVSVDSTISRIDQVQTEIMDIAETVDGLERINVDVVPLDID